MSRRGCRWPPHVFRFKAPVVHTFRRGEHAPPCGRRSPHRGQCACAEKCACTLPWRGSRRAWSQPRWPFGSGRPCLARPWRRAAAGAAAAGHSRAGEGSCARRPWPEGCAQRRRRAVSARSRSGPRVRPTVRLGSLPRRRGPVRRRRASARGAGGGLAPGRPRGARPSSEQSHQAPELERAGGGGSARLGASAAARHCGAGSGHGARRSYGHRGARHGGSASAARLARAHGALTPLLS